MNVSCFLLLVTTLQAGKSIAQGRGCCICCRGAGFLACISKDLTSVWPWIHGRESVGHSPAGERTGKGSCATQRAMVAYGGWCPVFVA